VDSETACAYEFKVSGKNAWAEFYKDVVKVLMWNQHRKKKLSCLTFITEEKYGKPFLDAPMPRDGVVSLGAHALAISTLQDFCALRWAQPLAGAKSKLLDTLHSADPGGEFRAEQAGVGGFVRESSHGCELLVDRICSQTA